MTFDVALLIPIHIPMLTHKSTASETGSLMIAACLSAIWLDRAGESFFDAQMIHFDTSRICLRLYSPMRAHFLDRRELVSQMVCTFLFWKSYGFLHGYNTCISSILIDDIAKFVFLTHNLNRY